MEKKETKDNAGRIADILRSHPDILADLEDYINGEGKKFIERLRNPANLYKLDDEVINRTLGLMVEVADIPGLFAKLYIITLERRLVVNGLSIEISKMLERGEIEKAKKLVKCLIESTNEDNNENNGH